MKLANIKTVSGIHLAAETARGIVDLTAAGCPLSLQDLICGADRSAAVGLAADESLPVVEAPVFENVVSSRPGRSATTTKPNSSSSWERPPGVSVRPKR